MTTRQRKIAAIVSKLLEWYSVNARDLPWRRTTDPYAVFVSEIMLQQTQVKTVLPYFERWMQALPTLESLARAKSGRLHKLWEGLGYYSRVRNLQKAARIIMRDHDGVFPRSFEDILALPGVGRYTAGAICSIAFGTACPILDGNVMRVLTRLYAIDTDPRDKATNTRLWSLATDLVKSSKSPSQLNQSLMELGALLCTPRNPSCTACPLAQCCIARRQGRQTSLPARSRRTKISHLRFVAFLPLRRGRILVRQRPAGTVNGHLWEFPNLELSLGGASTLELKKMAGRTLGAAVKRVSPFCTVKHSISRYRIRLDAFVVELLPRTASGRSPQDPHSQQVGQAPNTASHPLRTRDRPRSTDYWTTSGPHSHDVSQTIPKQSAVKWLLPAQLRKLAFPSAHKQILDRVLEQLNSV